MKDRSRSQWQNMVFVLVLLWVRPVAAESESGGSFSFRGNSVSFHYSEQELFSTPSWKPEQEEPPLSVSRAVQLARSHFSRFAADASSFKIMNIRLTTTGSNKWLYEIYFLGPLTVFPREHFTLWVKMDGALVEPSITSHQ